MKNTLIPLDMIFADASGTVTRIHENAVPGNLVPVDGGYTMGQVDMLEVLRTPASRLSEMGRVGRERVLLRHDVDTEARKLVSLFQGAA